MQLARSSSPMQPEHKDSLHVLHNYAPPAPTSTSSIDTALSNASHAASTKLLAMTYDDFVALQTQSLVSVNPPRPSTAPSPPIVPHITLQLPSYLLSLVAESYSTYTRPTTAPQSVLHDDTTKPLEIFARTYNAPEPILGHELVPQAPTQQIPKHPLPVLSQSTPSVPSVISPIPLSVSPPSSSITSEYTQDGTQALVRDDAGRSTFNTPFVTRTVYAGIARELVNNVVRMWIYKRRHP